MGCFISHGCISQLPISGGDRVVGFLCRIESSLEHSNAIEVIDDFNIYPICPILYGKYDDYGSMEPDESPTVKLLEEFFEKDITEILCSFGRLTSYVCTGDDWEVLQPLIDKHDWSLPRSVRIHQLSEKKDNYFINRYCLLLEHESVVRNIIDSHKPMLEEFYQYIQHSPQSDWDSLYDEQRQFFIDNGLDVYGNKPDPDTNWFDVSKTFSSYANLLFPPQDMNSYRGIYRSRRMMDLFQNYPSMFKHAFDIENKKDYLDTLRFFDVLDVCQLKPFINRLCGTQFENLPLWNTLTSTYQDIIKDKL